MPSSLAADVYKRQGKEHVAQLIHRESRRAGKPFVAVDCGAIGRELAASEFFGHVKGCLLYTSRCV